MPLGLKIDILLIGNNGSALESLKSVLRGYPRLGSMQWCDKCIDGIAKINNRRPGLVLLASSLLLEEATTCIREIQKLRPQPISLAILEGHHRYQQVLSVGVSDVLMNGYSVQELFDKIDFLQVSSAAFHVSNPGFAVDTAF